MEKSVYGLPSAPGNWLFWNFECSAQDTFVKLKHLIMINSFSDGAIMNLRRNYCPNLSIFTTLHIILVEVIVSLWLIGVPERYNTKYPASTTKAIKLLCLWRKQPINVNIRFFSYQWFYQKLYPNWNIYR